MKFLITFILTLTLSSLCSAQSSYVRAGYSLKDKAAVVKWFAEKNSFDEGVVIYRKDNTDNSWVKLTGEPLKKAPEVSGSDKETDSLSSIYNYILYNKPAGKDEYESWEFTLITFSLLNNDFAEYAVLGYTDETIEPGKNYSYKVSYIRSGSEVELGVSNETGSSLPVIDAVNSSLTAVQNKENVLLNWTPEPDKFIAYNLYREGNSEKVKVNDEAIYPFNFSSNGSTLNPGYLYSDSALIPDRTYNYFYTGLDAFGNESPLSNGVSITVLNSSLPPKPVSIRSDGNNKLTLSWRVSSTDNLKGFNILRGEDVKSEFVKINSALLSPSDTSYIDNTAAPDTRYFYIISSESMSGVQNYAGPMAASFSDYSKPLPPVSLKAKSDSNTVKLNWEKSPSANVIGYKVFRIVKSQNDEVLLLTPLPVKETYYIDSLLKSASNDFEYNVVAVNQIYKNSDYSKTGVVKLKDTKAPSVPVINSISPGDNSVTIEWIPLYESDLAGYKMYRSEDSTSGYIEVSSQLIGGDKKSFSDNSLMSGKAYYYKLAAQDISGNVSPLSDPAMFTFIAEENISPEIKLTAAFNKAKGTVDLSWTTPAGLSSPLQGFIIMRRTGEEEYSFAASDLLNTNNFSDTGLESSAEYFYSLQIILENGDVFTSPEQLIELN